MEGQLRDLSRPLSDRPSSSSSTYGKAMPLKLGKEIFLSHSGGDKEFVWFLYKDLCRRYSSDTIAFFDVDSLPKATAISMKNILEEARSSKLGVLVLTEDFFMKTPNPMLELEAFVAGEVRLLPLFFGMSVDEFKEKSRRAKWEKQWRTWSSKQLGGSSVEETIKKWRAALDIVNSFSGLEYCKEAKTEHEYVDRIVEEVTHIIHLLIPLREKGVCGKDRLCQIVDDMYMCKECASKHLSVDRTTQATSTHVNYRHTEDEYCRMVLVVGIYGFAGIGKTTLCGCLHDFYFGEFNGRVCYIDLGYLPFDQTGSMTKPSFRSFLNNMQHMLFTLTDYINDNPYYSYIDQVKWLLNKRLQSLTCPIFLAMDINILHLNLDQLEARLEEAKFYLSCEFPKGSKIFITSRSQHVLENLTKDNRFSVVIKYMPPLLLEEARDIFVHEMSNSGNFKIPIKEDKVNEYVKMCTFESHRSLTKHYHPWMLRSLVGSVKDSQDWEKCLRMLHSEGIVDIKDALKKVFKMLNITFMLLSKEQQKVFLDFALFYNFTDYGPKVYAWIKQFYSQKQEKYVDEIFLRLGDLCFIEKHSWRPPNLVLEFCRYIVTQGEYAQYYKVVEANTCWRDVIIPRSVRYISISGCEDSPDTAYADLDLRDVEAVEVLHLDVGIKHAAVVRLSITTCARLCSLIVRVPPGTSLDFVMEGNWPFADAPIHQALQRSLFCFELQGNVCFKSSQCFKISSWLASNVGFQALRRIVLAVDRVAVNMDLSSSVLGALRNLEIVSLSKLPLQRIDVTTCSKLEELSLTELPYLRSISGLDKLTSFKHLTIRSCKQLPMLTIDADSDHLITDCKSLKRISLCTKLSYPGADPRHRPVGPRLGVFKCPSLKNVDGLLQYTGDFSAANGVQLEETFGDLLQAAAIDSSICKAKVRCLDLKGNPAGLAGVCKLQLRDAQHIGLLISALTKAHPKHLHYLDISCKEGGDCGCDKDAPQFGPFPSLNRGLYLGYHCPQVRDLESSLAHLECRLRVLNLTGCTSVEKWPDFATMAGLEELELSYTSLKEWPTSLVLPLRDFQWGLDMRGCKQLPAEELMKGIAAIRHEMPLPHGYLSCITTLLLSLLADLKAGERDRCSIVDAVHSYHQEFVALLHPSSFSTDQVDVTLEILYRVWFGEGDAAHAFLPDVIRNKLSRLLCSEKTMSIPFHDWRESMSALLDRANDYSRLLQEMMVRRLMGVALIGGASIGWFKAAVNDDLLKDSFIPFLEWFTHAPNSIRFLDESFVDMGGKKLRERVGEAACNIARVPIVATALGADFVERLEAQVHGVHGDNMYHLRPGINPELYADVARVNCPPPCTRMVRACVRLLLSCLPWGNTPFANDRSRSIFSRYSNPS